MVVGVSDDVGMLVHVDEAKRREALGLVRQGRMYDLGRVLDERVPVFPGRYFRQTLVTTAHHATFAAGRPQNHSTGIVVGLERRNVSTRIDEFL